MIRNPKQIPGTRFQIDATIADIYLVSSLDVNKVIGRPVIYAVIDVFSYRYRIICRLEGPSWIGAMMALDNMVADKVHFVNSMGLKYLRSNGLHIYEIIIAIEVSLKDTLLKI